MRLARVGVLAFVAACGGGGLVADVDGGGNADLGNAVLDVVGCEGGFGSVGAMFMGAAVYCQSDSANGFYQCDELADRFERDVLAHPTLDNVVTDYASSMCATSSNAYSVWSDASSGRTPVAGDLLVWNGSPGHVAVVTSFDGSSVAFVQQNGNGPSGEVSWQDAFFGALDGLSPECFIHAESTIPVAFPSGPDCGCFDGEGDYCGLAIVDHESWYGCTANFGGATPRYDTLYTCAGAAFSVKLACTSCITPNLQPATGACQ